MIAAVPTQYLVHCTIMHPSLTALFCPTGAVPQNIHVTYSKLHVLHGL